MKRKLRIQNDESDLNLNQNIPFSNKQTLPTPKESFKPRFSDDLYPRNSETDISHSYLKIAKHNSALTADTRVSFQL
jgi:hypothetical protein